MWHTVISYGQRRQEQQEETRKMYQALELVEEVKYHQLVT